MEIERDAALIQINHPGKPRGRGSPPSVAPQHTLRAHRTQDDGYKPLFNRTAPK
jgi:hypothetical protein